MAELTKEEQVQAIYDLKVGYTLGHADIAMLKSMARQLLASMEQEPVAQVYQPANIGICAPLGPSVMMLKPLSPGAKLYAAPQLPQPAVPTFDEWCLATGNKPLGWVKDTMREAYDGCRAAMLQGNHRDLSHPVDQQVDEHEKIMQQAMPDGWVMVPKRLTAENGAKAALIGEFSLEYSLTCHECFGEGCEDCSGDGAWTNTVPIDWATIKDIWAKAIDHFAAAPQQEVKLALAEGMARYGDAMQKLADNGATGVNARWCRRVILGTI